MSEAKDILVSIRVIAYNSANTILDTLESIKTQTYPNIELIISDDCSKDKTVEICREWLEKNGSRFARTELITVPQNIGVSANINRAENACRGEWIKGIAGDDLLMPNCVQDCMDYVAEHPDTIYLFGRCKAFGTDEERCKEIDAMFDYSFFNMSQEQQLHRLIVSGNCIPASASFYNRVRFMQLGIKNDERIPMMEDWPKWINLLKAGAELHFMDTVLVKYRVSENSLSTAATKSVRYSKSEMLMYKYYQFPYLYRHGNKKEAVLKLMQAEKFIHDNAFIWRMIVYIYKKIIGVNNRSTIK